MGKFKQCHLELDFSGRAPNMCITTQCPCWKWKRSALESVSFQTPRRVQSLEGAMNDNLKLRFLRDILFSIMNSAIDAAFGMTLAALAMTTGALGWWRAARQMLRDWSVLSVDGCYLRWSPR